MKNYAFELGTNVRLSLAELNSILGENNHVELIDKVAIFILSEKTDFLALQKRLGGTIKIMEVLEEIPQPSSATQIETTICSNLEKHISNIFKNYTGKARFSVSTFGPRNAYRINIKKILNFLKVFLKNSLNLNSRFVNKDKYNPKSSTIYKAKIIEKGVDLNIIQGSKAWYIAKGISIQNIDDYSRRDYHKPARDAKIGMLPPKLAQIMINLAGESKSIFDPFCGTGTVLMEGLLMDKDVLGSDINEDMIDATEKNCKWTEERFATKSQYATFLKDARSVSQDNLPFPIDAIVTEGYLGPPRKTVPEEFQIMKQFNELSMLHSQWLKKAAIILPKNGKVVMCVAAYNSRGKTIHLPEFKELAERAGFRVSQVFTYGRPNQTIARDIKILEKL